MHYQMEQILRAVQKPGRYTGGECGAVMKDKEAMAVRFALCFPDVYEVGMSHLGIKILYNIINQQSDMWCERAFAPWFDMGAEMRRRELPLTALESRDPLRDFDAIGFTLQYELSYTNILYMLDLAGIPLLACERNADMPLIIGGGPCACNPEPIAEIFDLFALGEGEEVILELCELIRRSKHEKLSREALLREAAKIEGVYVPSLYTPSYYPNGRLASMQPEPDAPAKIGKRIITDFNDVMYPETVPVPMIEAIHDRATIEVLRGCIRGCRFCQAGFIYRPFREKDVETLDCQARALCQNTGYEELSLVSLSTSDHSGIEPLLDRLLKWTQAEKVSLSLPSMRIDNFDADLARRISAVRKTGLTFAPEAGTQSLRDAINKNVTEDEILAGCRAAFAGGYTAVKLYFMLGLPGETDADVVGIAELAQKIVDCYYAMPERPKGKSVLVSVSCAYFIPKPFTPFQFCAQDTMDEFRRKQRLLLDSIRTRKISVSWHDAQTSLVEAVLARGDRRILPALLDVYRDGGIFDSWDEGFSFERWMAAFEDNGIDPAFYANRIRPADELLPWDHLDYGVGKKFLVAEYKRAMKAAVTPNCREQCAGCGITKMTGRTCFAKRETAFLQNI